jgi:phosphatidate cytidylyltransferase
VSPLALRFLSAIVGIPVMIGLTLAGGVPYLLLVLVGAVVGMLELTGMLRHAGFRPLVPLGVGLSAALVLTAPLSWPHAAPGVLAVGTVAGLVWLFGRVDEPGAIADWALSIAPALYVGGLLRFAVTLRETPDGLGLDWVAVTLVCTWASDIAAYFVGRAWGRRRLAPKISPGKSVEGAVAGLAAAALVAPLVTPALSLVVSGLVTLGLPAPLPPAAPSVARLVGLGLVVGLCAPLGDLLESFVKRQCGAKDSGALIPGHGGILDRIDSLMLAIVGAYLYVVATT